MIERVLLPFRHQVHRQLNEIGFHAGLTPFLFGHADTLPDYEVKVNMVDKVLRETMSDIINSLFGKRESRAIGQ
jgi:hypothetical protein